MAMDTGFDSSRGSSVTCFLPFLFLFLGFLAFLVGVDVGIVLIFVLILLLWLSLPSFVGSSGANTGGTDFFGTSGVGQGLLRISVICGGGCFASFCSKGVEEVVEEVGRSWSHRLGRKISLS